MIGCNHRRGISTMIAGVCAALIVAGVAYAGSGGRRATAAPSVETVVQSAHADVDGDGRRDLVTIRQVKRAVAGGEELTWKVQVQLAAGRTVFAPLRGGPVDVRLIKVGNVDGRRGAELFVSSPSVGSHTVEIYTYRRGDIHRLDKTFSYGSPGIGVLDGVKCSTRHHGYFIAQQVYDAGAGTTGRATYSTQLYRWNAGTLRHVSHRKVFTRARSGPSSVQCGHAPTA